MDILNDENAEIERKPTESRQNHDLDDYDIIGLRGFPEGSDVRSRRIRNIFLANATPGNPLESVFKDEQNV